MKMSIIGLGRMGNAIAQRLVDAGHEIFGFDLDANARHEAKKIGVKIVNNTVDLLKNASILWIMVPPGGPVDAVIKELLPDLSIGTVIIDGGNSYYEDSIRRAELLKMHDLFFLDCGTSGGLRGRAHGFCLMVGGDQAAYTKVYSLLAAIAVPGALAYVGPSGAGHYVKMVHNGIEYGLLQAYAEGFDLIKNGTFRDQHLDLEEIARIWNNGSVIRSWILGLIQEIFEEDQELHAIRGEIEETGMGKWTVEEALKHEIPAVIIEQALKTRSWSRETGGNYTTKIIALLRKKFGGHSVKHKE